MWLRIQAMAASSPALRPSAFPLSLGLIFLQLYILHQWQAPLMILFASAALHDFLLQIGE